MTGSPFSGSARLRPEQELMLRLCGTAHKRNAARDRIVELAERADYDVLGRILDAQLLLPLVGARLLEVAPGRAPEPFRERVEQVVRHCRHRATLHQAVTVSLLQALEGDGITAVPLKGSLLAEQIFGDPGLRLSADLDLLVSPADLNRAVGLLRERGYGASADIEWQDGLPLLHHALPPERAGVPPIDLHWRIHWYETSFSAALLQHSDPDPLQGRRPRPAHELATLLLFFARNSLYGLRLAADLAAWWDSRAHALPRDGLQQIMCMHPELRDALSAATTAAHRLVGLPRERVLPQPWRPGRRALAAARLANWDGRGSRAQVDAAMMAVDWLLMPRSQWRSFARRYMFQPATAIARTYDRPVDAGLTGELWRYAHGTARTGKFAVRYWRCRWALREGATWSPSVPLAAPAPRPPAGPPLRVEAEVAA